MNCACNRYKTCTECRDAYKESVKRDNRIESKIEKLEKQIDVYLKEAAQKDNYCLSYRAAGIAEAIFIIRGEKK